MSTADDDREIRNQFKKTHEHHEFLAPAFREVLEQASRRHAQGSIRRFRLAMAAFVSVALISAGVVWHERSHSRPANLEFFSLSNWHAPTDFLLKTPGAELLETTPAIPSGLPDLQKIQTIQIPSGNAR